MVSCSYWLVRQVDNLHTSNIKYMITSILKSFVQNKDHYILIIHFVVWYFAPPPRVWAHVAIKLLSSSCWHLPQDAISCNSCIWLIVVWWRPDGRFLIVRSKCLSHISHKPHPPKISGWRVHPLSFVDNISRGSIAVCANIVRPHKTILQSWLWNTMKGLRIFSSRLWRVIIISRAYIAFKTTPFCISLLLT